MSLCAFKGEHLGRRCARLVASFLLILLMGSFCCTYPIAANSSGQYVSRLTCDFESCTPNSNYTNFISNTNISSVHWDSRVMLVGGDSSIGGGTSLQINQCDIRWNDLHVEDSFFKISFKLKLDKSFNQTITLKLSTQDSLTELDSDAGVLLSVRKSTSGDITLQGSDLTSLTTLRTETIYSIELLVERGSDSVLVRVNGKELSKRYSFVSKIYFIDGMSISCQSNEGESGFWLFDDLEIAVKGRSYAQTYSAQSPGKPVDVLSTEPSDNNDFKVYVNDRQIGIYDYYVSSQVVYISAEQFFESIQVPYTYDEKQQLLTVENDRVQASVRLPGNVVNVNGTDVTLVNPVRTIDDILMIPPNFINEVFNAKVWWDSAQNLLVITTGAYKTDGILRKISSKLYMNGEPYYNLGYSAMDLFQNVLSRYLDADNNTVESWTKDADSLLSELNRQGVRAIRISCAQDLLQDLIYDDVSTGKYFEAMDALFDLCDRYEIQVVACLHLISDGFIAKEYVPRYGWISMNESLLDLVTDDQCASRNVLRLFVERFVNRYKNRNTILMYEISDGANLYADTGHYHNGPTYSVAQLALFYQYCADLIRTYDPVRLIGSGDGLLLPYQWSLYTQIVAGQGDKALDVTSILPDQQSEFLKAFALLNRSLDIVSVQTPGELFQSLNRYYLNGDNVQLPYGYGDYLLFAEILDKPLYSSLGQEDLFSDFSVRNAVMNGIQLSFWDGLHEDGFKENQQLLTEGNLINFCAIENTNLVWGDSTVDVFDPEGVISVDDIGLDTGNWNSVIRFAVIFTIMAMSSLLILFAFRNKKVV